MEADKETKTKYERFFGGLKDSKAIIEIKEDCKKIRESAKLRTL